MSITRNSWTEIFHSIRCLTPLTTIFEYCALLLFFGTNNVWYIYDIYYLSISIILETLQTFLVDISQISYEPFGSRKKKTKFLWINKYIQNCLKESGINGANVQLTLEYYLIRYWSIDISLLPLIISPFSTSIFLQNHLINLVTHFSLPAHFF